MCDGAGTLVQHSVVRVFDQKTSWLCLLGGGAAVSAGAGVLHRSPLTGTDSPIVALEARAVKA